MNLRTSLFATLSALVALALVQSSSVLAQGDTWSPTGTMGTHRDSHSALNINGATYVIGGRVDVTGHTTRTSEALTSVFAPVGSMVYDRSFFPAVPIAGTTKVLLAGGYSSIYGSIPVAELFNTSTGTFASTGRMSYARELFTGTALPNGQILVAAGFSNGTILNSAELYTPSTGTFALTVSMAHTRHGHTAMLLATGPNSGKVLVTGGRTANNISLSSAETYTPASGAVAATWTAGPAPANNLIVDRFRHTATTLHDGRILYTGGYSSTQGNTVASAETYDPNTNTFTLLASTMSESRMDHSATLLPDGRVLIAGGWNSFKSSTVASVDIFDPVTNTFTPAAPLPISRHEQAATLLPDGTVLITGGLQYEPTVQQTLNDAYRYTPSTGPDFSVAVSPSSQIVAQGATATYALSATPTGGFTGDVTWGVDGLPEGATASFDSPVNNTNLRISTSASTPGGSYSIRITGGNGTTIHTVSATLVVNAPDFAIAASTGTLTLNPGTSATDGITVTAVNGFASNVALTLSGLPAGVTAGFSPASMTGSGTSSLTLTTGSSTSPGTYPITVTGSGRGLSHSIGITLVVAAPDFTISAAPSSRTIRRGASTNYAVTVAPTGPAKVTAALSISGLPTGVTAQFSPTATSSTSTLTILSTTSATRGTFTLTITGTAGSIAHKTTVSLSITR